MRAIRRWLSEFEGGAMIHGTIDNPDVQKLYIRNNRERAASECRQRFPEQLITVEEPFRFRVFDLRFRY